MNTLSQTESSLDDLLKLANIEKTKVESEKLRLELESAPQKERKAYWTDIAKIVGGVILGAGGLMAAVTQYEVGEMRAKTAKNDLDKAVSERAAADAAASAAKRDLADALEKKRIVLEEHASLEKQNALLRQNLAKTDHALLNAQPQIVRPRLTYIQFQGSLKREFIDALREYLKTEYFNAPAAERVGGPWTTRVKYFTANDQAIAEKLAKSVEGFLADQGCPRQIPVTLDKAPAGETPPLEVWLAGSCK
ncbi:hypothetical protein [Paraburkholderia terrae]|uniref:hypothetical protein n=1 Tax=Paraburkholderia terrae TaxID=311230 RepID=UPI0020637C83|nr:hypothetical protein [Paraburkholderia terrae]BDC46014.1 hypothetical protein PTKU15_93110 [Paraburkholderia terrae]